MRRACKGLDLVQTIMLQMGHSELGGVEYPRDTYDTNECSRRELKKRYHNLCEFPK